MLERHQSSTQIKKWSIGETSDWNNGRCIIQIKQKKKKKFTQCIFLPVPVSLILNQPSCMATIRGPVTWNPSVVLITSSKQLGHTIQNDNLAQLFLPDVLHLVEASQEKRQKIWGYFKIHEIRALYFWHVSLSSDERLVAFTCMWTHLEIRLRRKTWDARFDPHWRSFLLREDSLFERKLLCLFTVWRRERRCSHAMITDKGLEIISCNYN